MPEGATPRRPGVALLRPTRGQLIAILAAWAAVALAYLGARAVGRPDELAAAYWTNAERAGAPALTRVDRSINVGRDDLVRLLGESPAYGAAWSGVAYAARDGEYVFTVTSDDGSWVLLDGETVIDNGGRHGARTATARVRLTRGAHRLEVRYFDAGGFAVMAFSWRAAGALGFVLPPGVLYASEAGTGRGASDWALVAARLGLGWLLLAVTAAALLAGALRLHGRGDLEAALATLLFALLLGAYAVRLAHQRSTSVTACDMYAYVQGATAMAAHGPLHDELRDPLVPQVVSGFRTRPSDRDLAFFLSPHGHYVSDFGRGVSRNVFPPGLMWLLLPAAAGGGPSLALLVLPVLTSFLVLAFFLLARRHEGVWVATCAAAFLAWNPVVFETTVLPMSDVPSMALTAASAFLLFLNVRRPRAALPFAAGVCFGVALTVRYSNAAAIVPLLALFALDWARGHDVRRVARDVALFGLAGAVAGLLPLALFTHAQFGTVLHLTYDPYTASRMQLEHFLPNLAFYGRGLVSTFGVFGVAVAAVGVGACLARRGRRAFALAAALALAAFLLPYAFESLREHRYLMPVYPWLALLYGLGALALGDLLRHRRTLRALALAVLAVAPLLWSWSRLPGGVFHRDRTCAALAARVEPDAVIMCDDLSGPVRLYSGLTGYRFVWTRLEVLAEACETLARLGRPVYFLLDCDAARAHFKFLRDKGVLPAASLTVAGDVNGLPLWRYVKPD